MLPQKNRLTRQRDFKALFKKGKIVKGDFLIIRVLKNNLKLNRCGFIISKKVSKKATQRNKIKRRLREVVLTQLKSLNGFLDVVVVALPRIAEKSFSQVREEVIRLFKKIKI